MARLEEQVARGADPYYRATGMIENLIRDEPVSDVVRENFADGHARAFATWRSLALDEGLDDAQAVELMPALVAR